MTSRKLRVVEKMEGYAKARIVEPTNNNDGEQINKMQDLLKKDKGTPSHKGAAYCLLSLIYCLCVAEAERTTGDVSMAGLAKTLPSLRQWIMITAGCTELMNDAKRRGTWIPRSDWGKAEAGDWVIFDWTKPGGELQRHIAALRVKPDGGNLHTVEGNTSPGSSSNDPGAHGGFYIRNDRPLDHHVLGFVRIPE